MTTYFDYYARSKPIYQPADKDVVDFDAVEVTEAEVAEISVGIFLSQQEREELERAFKLTED